MAPARRGRFRVCWVACFATAGILFGVGLGLTADVPALDTCRQLARAHYENDDFQAAVAQFRHATELAPESAPDAFNLGLALMRAEDYTNALVSLRRAEVLAPGLLAPRYVEGIIAKRQGEFPQAIECLRQVVTADPACVGARYNLAMCYKATEQYTNAVTTLLEAVAREPANPGCHYQLITLYRRLGNVESAARHAEIFDRIKDTVTEAEKTPEALERSRYSALLPTPSGTPDLPGARGDGSRFVDVTREAGLAAVEPDPPALTPPPRELHPTDYKDAVAQSYAAWTGGALAVGDYDGDGHMDLYVVAGGAGGHRLLRNDGHARFTDVTAAAGVGSRGRGTHAVFGDYDNDRWLDLYVVHDGPNVLYRNRGDGTFEDRSVPARANEPQFGRRAAFVDYDHDNDVDLLIANDVDLAAPPPRDRFTLPDDFPGQFNTLLRNQGDGTFADLTDEAGLLVDAAQTCDVVCADFDEDNDTDLFVANFNAPSLLFLNARQGRFVTGGSFTPPLNRGVTAAAEGDFNRDGRPDLFVAMGRSLVLYTNDGRAGFSAPGPPHDPGPSTGSGTVISRIGVLDHNNDGWPDVITTDGLRLTLLAGTGRGSFTDVTVGTGLDQVAGAPVDVAAADFDHDGDLDVVLQTRDRGPVLLRNDGASDRHWLALRLYGKKVNRRGYGASVEVAAPGYYQRQTVTGDVVHFGLGGLTNVQVVRVTWPNGMAQNVIQPAVDRLMEIEEYVKVSASCAFLWADGGQGFKLINEILGVGPLGVPMTATECFPVDCTELTKIEPDQLAEREGRYELRLTEDLRELAYVDQINLRVIDHPAGLEIVPNEMFTGPPFPEDRFFAVGERRPPRSAVDDRGQDVLELVTTRDGRYPTFPRTAHDGVAQLHSLTLDLGDLSGAGQVLLHLDGWIYWADSSVSWGVFQNPRIALVPLRLEARNAQGDWQTVIESVGLPTSKGSVVPVDLTGKLPTNDGHVRLSTSLCVYFDRIFVTTRDDADLCRVHTLPVQAADLHFRGFAELHRDALGYERFDYDRVSPHGAWDPPRGFLTRYGEVTALLGQPDDLFVVFGPGDELTMRFDATELPALPAGWERSFVFYANGWVKDGDLNTKASETVGPLPFHGMSAYPYPAAERYPESPAHREYLRTYQTRPTERRTGDLTQLQP